MTAVPLGIALGALNVIVIAVGLAVAADESGIALWVIAFGIVPGVVLGALLGWIADVMKPLPIWVRRLVLLVPAVALVAALAAEFALQQFILLASIPTAVATLLLERSTRPSEPPPVPLAQARRG
jgi:hypothetical protein